MKKLILYLCTLCLSAISCTKDKTDYKAEIDTAVIEHTEFKEAVSIRKDGYLISIESLNGTFYKGYNELRLKIKDSQTKQKADVSAVTFIAIMENKDGTKSSCPHRYSLLHKAEADYFSGYSVFTDQNSPEASWNFYITFSAGNKNYSVKQAVSVQQQTNKNLNMTAFTGNDGERYFIALVSPQKPKVAENELIAGVYKLNKPKDPPLGSFPDPSQFLYTEVTGYTLQLDPRMPEPSMGNHSSPNNKYLTQESDGLYHGVVNYTMTGNWTLNFILLNSEGKILKGTVVPKDFTPGAEGTKSELFIDILF